MRRYVVKSNKRGGHTKPNRLLDAEKKARTWRETTARKLSSPWDARKPLT